MQSSLCDICTGTNLQVLSTCLTSDMLAIIMNKAATKEWFGTALGKVVTLIAFFVGFAVVSALFQTGASNPTNNLTTDTGWRPYTSSQFGFTASFPGNAATSNSSLDVQGVSVPTTTYERDNGSSYYLIQVIEYPSQFDMSDTNARLEGALNGSVENTKNATLASSSFTQFAGYTAIQGVISVPNGSDTITEHETAFLKGNTMYVLLSSGGSDDDNSTFTNSFHFN